MKSNYFLLLLLFFSFIGIAQTVNYSNPPTTLVSMTSYSFDVTYTSNRDFDIFFEFRKGIAGSAMGFKKTAVTAGTDVTISIPITLAANPPRGNDYLIRTYFQDIDGVFQGPGDFTGIEVTIDVTEDIVNFKMPPQILFSQTSYNFDIAYEAVEDRDIIFELWSASGKLGEGRTPVLAGSGDANVVIDLMTAPSIGDGYFYKVFMVPTSGDISMATATTTDITGISVVDFLGQPCAEEVEEANGLVIIEAEDFDITGTAWQRKTIKTQYTGISYLEWLGNDFFGNPGNGVISAKIKITKTGRYRFQWRNRVGFGSNGTEHNDSWLKFPDVPAEDFYGEKGDGSRTYPRGSGLTPNPEGASGSGWFKIYANSLDWNFNATTGDNADGRPVYVEFDTPGVYTLQISGRSKNHLIDRIVLHNGASNPTDIDNNSSNCSSILGISDYNLRDFGVISFPNPVVETLFINGLELTDEVDIMDMFGRKVTKGLRVKNIGTQEMNTANLGTGIYFLRVKDKGVERIIIR